MTQLNIGQLNYCSNCDCLAHSRLSHVKVSPKGSLHGHSRGIVEQLKLELQPTALTNVRKVRIRDVRKMNF
jgi:hypothetical protein